MIHSQSIVAPLAGAWIEIAINNATAAVPKVAPLAGAWIEICLIDNRLVNLDVAPLAGAWIEIVKQRAILEKAFCRSPRGSVD